MGLLTSEQSLTRIKFVENWIWSSKAQAQQRKSVLTSYNCSACPDLRVMLNFERMTDTFALQHQVDWPTQKDQVDKIKSSMIKIHNAATNCKIHYVTENGTCGMIDLLGISSSWCLAQNSHDAIWCEHTQHFSQWD